MLPACQSLFTNNTLTLKVHSHSRKPAVGQTLEESHLLDTFYNIAPEIYQRWPNCIILKYTVILNQ